MGFFLLALTDGNVQVRFLWKVVLKFWDLWNLASTTSYITKGFQNHLQTKSNLHISICQTDQTQKTQFAMTDPVDRFLTLHFLKGSEVSVASKQEKVKDYPWVKTQVKSLLGHINVTLFFWARFSPCYQNHHCRIIILEPIMTKIQLFRFNNGMAFMATLVFVILAFQSRSTSANDVSARFWPFSIKSS